MPLPLIVPIAMGVAGLFGAGKAVKGAIDSSKANDIESTARWRIENADEQLEQSKTNTNGILAKYGKKKLDALGKSVRPFVDSFKKLKNVELANSEELQRLHVGDFSEANLGELESSCDLAVTAFQGLGTGAVGGALTAFGAYSGTMLLASAGTGTAISALSGIAATNATLAWLGGGTLAAGGLGVAGGTMVLGALVAGPALLIFGSIFGSKASAKLDNARANNEKSLTYAEEVDTICQKLSMIDEVTNLASATLSKLRSNLRRSTNLMDQAIEKNGIDFKNFINKDRETVFKAVKFAQLVKMVIYTPILTDNGDLVDDSDEKFDYDLIMA
jgi:hypothetical protein